MEKTIEKKPEEGVEIQLSTVDTTDDIIFKPQKKKKLPKIIGKVILLIVVLAIIGGGGYLVYNLFFKEEKVEIKTAQSMITTLETKISGNGTANSKDRQSVVGLAKGEVTDVFVADGDYVEIGQPLYVVDSSEVVKQIGENDKILNKANVDIADIYKEMNGQIVRAPFDGKTMMVEGMKDKKEGDDVSKGELIAQFVDDSKMRVSSEFSVAYMEQIKVGDPAQVSLPTIMTLLSGTVESVGTSKKIRDEGIIVFDVVVVLDNPGVLRAGMDAMVVIDTSAGEAMPAEAAKLKYFQEVPVNLVTGGQIAELNIKNQYTFKEGDVICRINNELLAEKLVGAQKIYDDKKVVYDELVAQLKHYTPLSEIAGTVTGLAVAIGDKLAGSATVVMNISDLTGMVLDVNIDEKDVSKVKVGMEVNINANGAPFVGKFTKIATEGKMEGYQGMSVFPAKIEIYDTKELMPGMWMDYTCVVSRIENCIVVPSNALKYTEAGTVVFVREIVDGMTPCEVDPVIIPEGFKAILVVAGASDDFNIEIVQGLPEGIEVATLGQANDQEGGKFGNGNAIMRG